VPVDEGDQGIDDIEENELKHLTSYYRLFEGQGTNVTDITKSKNHLTVEGTWTPDKLS
jgi:hypothetical protein